MYADFAQIKSSPLEDAAGVLGYKVGYLGQVPNYRQFKTNMERVAYKNGIKCGAQDKAQGLTNMYADKSESL